MNMIQKSTKIEAEYLVRGLDNLRNEGCEVLNIIPDKHPVTGEYIEFYVFYNEPDYSRMPGAIPNDILKPDIPMI